MAATGATGAMEECGIGSGVTVKHGLINKGPVIGFVQVRGIIASGWRIHRFVAGCMSLESPGIKQLSIVTRRIFPISLEIVGELNFRTRPKILRCPLHGKIYYTFSNAPDYGHPEVFSELGYLHGEDVVRNQSQIVVNKPGRFEVCTTVLIPWLH